MALGPGFTAGEDVDYVIETMRGHSLGRIIKKGSALPNTGVPGLIAGIGKERVIHSPAAGNMKNICQIADLVEKDQVIAMVGDTPVKATISGVIRGLIRDGYPAIHLALSEIVKKFFFCSALGSLSAIFIPSKTG